MNKRIGPRMAEAASYVSSHPGCVVRECAHAVSPHPRPWRNEKLGYDIVNRAIEAGIIIAKPNPARKGSCILFPAEVVS